MAELSNDPNLLINDRHRFRLFHLMVLVAGIAITLVVGPALMRAVMRSYGPMSQWNQRMYLEGAVILSLSLWSLILTPLVLLMNHSRLAKSSRSLGTSAVVASGVAVGFMLLAKFIETALLWRTMGWSGEWSSAAPYLLILGSLYGEIPRVASASIFAAWSILGLSRVGRKPSGMFEWLGVSFGLCWIVWTLGAKLMYLSENDWLAGPGPTLW